jgi:hypothetical protein
MCYSAPIEASFATYVRATGAEMDILQLEASYGQPATTRQSRIRAPWILGSSGRSGLSS